MLFRSMPLARWCVLAALLLRDSLARSVLCSKVHRSNALGVHRPTRSDFAARSFPMQMR